MISPSRLRALSVALPNKRMQLTKRGDLAGVARFARQSSLSRALQLIRGVRRTNGAVEMTCQPSVSQPRGVLGVLLVALLGCSIQLGGAQERRLVLLNEGTVERRLQIAQEYVTEQQLGRLRTSAKAKFANLNDADLEHSSLSWQRGHLADGDSVMVVVTFTSASDAIDAKAVADYMAEQVRTELRPKLLSK
jgi:hypothetical protein